MGQCNTRCSMSVGQRSQLRSHTYFQLYTRQNVRILKVKQWQEHGQNILMDNVRYRVCNCDHNPFGLLVGLLHLLIHVSFSSFCIKWNLNKTAKM